MYSEQDPRPVAGDMTDLSNCADLATARGLETAQKDNAAENRGFVRIPENRWPPNEIDKAKSKREKRTKARAPRIAMHIEDRAPGSRTDIPGRPEG
jgi:hypothetical protein